MYDELVAAETMAHDAPINGTGSVDEYAHLVEAGRTARENADSVQWVEGDLALHGTLAEPVPPRSTWRLGPQRRGLSVPHADLGPRG